MLSKNAGLDGQQVEVLLKIQNDNARAKQLTNRLLDTARFESPIKNFTNNTSENSILNDLKRVLGRQSNSSDKLQEVLGELKNRLSCCEKGTLFLKRSIAQDVNPDYDSQLTIDRACRNIRIALRLIKQATILLTTDIKLSRQGVRLSQLIIQPLIEVFDLRGESIPERLQISNSLDEVRSICMEDGVILSIDSRLWNQDCCLDRERVNQVIVNLLLNSFKFRQSKIEISVNHAKDFLSLSIADDGEGIPPPDDADNLYFKFSNYTPEDLPVRAHGIGLIGVQVILQEMNGRLKLETDERQGAKFTITVPC